MFEFLQAVQLDPTGEHATGVAVVDGHALFDDHFPGRPVLPGSWLVELSAQLAGLLCEEVHRGEHGERLFAILGMVRNAKFLEATPLPARLELDAKMLRADGRAMTVLATVGQDGARRMQAELVLTLHEPSEDWSRAIEARDERLALLSRREEE